MNLFTIIFITLLSFICGLVYIFLSWNLSYWKKRGVKGPTPKLLFGNVPCIVWKNRHMVFDLQDLFEKYKKCGEKFIGIFITRNPQVLIMDPWLAHEILVTKFQSFRNNESSLWVNKNLEKMSGRNPCLCTVSDGWKERRNDFMGGISTSKLKSAHPLVMTICEKMSDFVRSSIKNNETKIDVRSLCFRLTMEITADFVWGISAGTLDCDTFPNIIFDMAEKMIEYSFGRIDFYYLTAIMPSIRKLIKDRFFTETTDNFFSKLQEVGIDYRLHNKSDRIDFLNYLLHLKEKKGISNLDMTGHSLTMLLNAFDTSALLLFQFLFFLAVNQDAQRILRAEIMDNIDKEEKGCISYKALINLPYLDQCFNEAMRLASPIPNISKICTEETFIEVRPNKKIKIEPGIIVHIPTHAFHHDDDIFPEPYKFIPERFNNGRAKELSQRGYFLPFGDGPRICAGMKFGQMCCKAAIFEIIHKFHLNICKDYSYPKVIDRESRFVGLTGAIFLEFEMIK